MDHETQQVLDILQETADKLKALAKTPGELTTMPIAGMVACATVTAAQMAIASGCGHSLVEHISNWVRPLGDGVKINTQGEG